MDSLVTMEKMVLGTARAAMAAMVATLAAMATQEEMVAIAQWSKQHG